MTMTPLIKALLVRFSPSAYKNAMKPLTRSRQTNTVGEYKARFETLSNKLKGLMDTYKCRCFPTGLRDNIRLPIRTFNPTNLTSTYNLAKIQEENVNLSKRGHRSGLTYSPDPGILKTPIHKK